MRRRYAPGNVKLAFRHALPAHPDTGQFSKVGFPKLARASQISELGPGKSGISTFNIMQ